MVHKVSRLATIVTSMCLISNVAAMGFEPMTATIRVSSGSLYDYVVIGEYPKATDVYDNAYDTISPGNLNADMGQPFISVIIRHPDWKPAMRELRGDIRSLAKRQEWQLAISSSLAKGTPLTIALEPDRTTLPKGMSLTLRDPVKKVETNLSAESHTITAPGQGLSSRLVIIVEQP